MNVIETEIPGLLIVEPKVFGDSRGFFIELYQADRYAESGIPSRFVQDNLSRSARGVLRGLHIQNPKPQGKLVTVLHGAVLDVVVDVRVGSPTFGRHSTVELNDQNRRQVWIPRGFAHGFQRVRRLEPVPCVGEGRSNQADGKSAPRVHRQGAPVRRPGQFCA